MGQPRRLGDAVFRGAGEGDPDGILQAALVTDGDKDRFDPAPRPDHSPDGLVTVAQQTGTTIGAVLVFLIFVVAAAEIAIAIPIVLLLVRRKRTLDLDAYTDLKG